MDQNPKSLATLRSHRALMIAYLDHKREVEDWHGVMDAAADIREIDAKLAVLRGQQPSHGLGQ